MSELFPGCIPLNAGWSGEKKYRFTDAGGIHCLVRIAPAEQEEHMTKVYSIMKAFAALDVPMCLPLSQGICEEGAYIVQTWVEGVELDQALPRLSKASQYALGVEAGGLLARMHTLSAPNALPWGDWYGRKLDKAIRTYHDFPIKVTGGELFLRIAEENRTLLTHRPTTLVHGDYHVGNMVLHEDGHIRIIDFNRCRTGDPWEEFRRIQWCVRVSPAFARGMVDGYFSEGVPEDFWRVLQLYTAASALGSMAWAAPFGEGEIAVMNEHARLSLTTWDHMTRIIPRWYEEAMA